MARTPITAIRFTQEDRRLLNLLREHFKLKDNTELLRKLIRDEATREDIKLEDFGTLQFYVKSTSNCTGLPLQTFKLLSETWKGDSIQVPFADEGPCEVVGITDLIGRRICGVSCAKVEQVSDKAQGFMIWGGNSGVRVLSEFAEVVEGVNDHLPQGYGMPLLWIENLEDLTQEVQEVVG